MKMHKCVNQAHSRHFTSMSCLLIHAACQPLSKLTMLYHVLPRGCQAQARPKLNLEPFQSHPRSSKYHSAFSILFMPFGDGITLLKLVKILKHKVPSGITKMWPSHCGLSGQGSVFDLHSNTSCDSQHLTLGHNGPTRQNDSHSWISWPLAWPKVSVSSSFLDQYWIAYPNHSVL